MHKEFLEQIRLALYYQSWAIQSSKLSRDEGFWPCWSASWSNYDVYCHTAIVFATTMQNIRPTVVMSEMCHYSPCECTLFLYLCYFCRRSWALRMSAFSDERTVRMSVEADFIDAVRESAGSADCCHRATFHRPWTTQTDAEIWHRQIHISEKDESWSKS